jgi:hypothetical protein
VKNIWKLKKVERKYKDLNVDVIVEKTINPIL